MNGFNKSKLSGLMDIYSHNIYSDSIIENSTYGDLQTQILTKYSNTGTDAFIVNNGMQLNSNITANSKSISPINVSYLDATSSIQTQINNIITNQSSTSGGGGFQINSTCTSFNSATNTGFQFLWGSTSNRGVAIANNCTMNYMAIKSDTNITGTFEFYYGNTISSTLSSSGCTLNLTAGN